MEGSEVKSTTLSAVCSLSLDPAHTPIPNSMHSGEWLDTTAPREASTIRQTGMGQSTPNLATKKILQGHHSDSPTEGMGAGIEGLKGSTWSPGPNAPPLQYSRHLAADIMKPGKLVVGWSPTGEANCLSIRVHPSPPGISKIIGEHMDQGLGGIQGTQTRKRFWVRGA